jgi:hypothetical protein
MTKPTGSRAAYRTTCGKCGAIGRWGEACIMCGATYTATEHYGSGAVHVYEYVTDLRVGHGKTCTAEGEPHKCHCGGGVSHPCNCYESPAVPSPYYRSAARVRR